MQCKFPLNFGVGGKQFKMVLFYKYKLAKNEKICKNQMSSSCTGVVLSCVPFSFLHVSSVRIKIFSLKYYLSVCDARWWAGFCSLRTLTDFCEHWWFPVVHLFLIWCHTTVVVTWICFTLTLHIPAEIWNIEQDWEREASQQQGFLVLELKKKQKTTLQQKQPMPVPISFNCHIMDQLPWSCEWPRLTRLCIFV